jgi:hypothetical protein
MVSYLICLGSPFSQVNSPGPGRCLPEGAEGSKIALPVRLRRPG